VGFWACVSMRDEEKREDESGKESKKALPLPAPSFRQCPLHVIICLDRSRPFNMTFSLLTKHRARRDLPAG